MVWENCIKRLLIGPKAENIPTGDLLSGDFTTPVDLVGFLVTLPGIDHVYIA